MKLRVLLISIISGYFLLSCAGSQLEKPKYKLSKKPPFSITDAYSQKWSKNEQGEQKGTDVYFKLASLRSRTTKVYFQQVFYDKKVAQVQKTTPFRVHYSDGTDRFMGSFTSDSIYISKRDSLLPSLKKGFYVSKNNPFDLKESEAIVSYVFEGNLRFYKIEGLIEKRSLIE